MNTNETENPPAEEPAPAKATRLLLVDDDPFIRRILAMGLKKDGFEVAEAEHGEAGLSVLAEGGIDAVIVDLMMPVMDGRSFIRNAREQFGANLPILVMTSVDRADAAKDVLDGGASAILHKPAKVPQILEKLREIGA